MMVRVSEFARFIYGIPWKSTRGHSINSDCVSVDRRCLRRYARRAAREMKRRGQRVMWKPHWRNL